MRGMLTVLLFVLSVQLQAHAADNAPGEVAIKSILTKPTSWTMYSEYTDSLTPTDRAQKLTFRYFERDQKLMGRWVLEFGSCEFEVSLRNNGFSHTWCPPYQGGPTLDFDLVDPKYPFRSRNPRKLWLKPDE